MWTHTRTLRASRSRTYSPVTSQYSAYRVYACVTMTRARKMWKKSSLAAVAVLWRRRWCVVTWRVSAVTWWVNEWRRQRRRVTVKRSERRSVCFVWSVCFSLRHRRHLCCCFFFASPLPSYAAATAATTDTDYSPCKGSLLWKLPTCDTTLSRPLSHRHRCFSVWRN